MKRVVVVRDIAQTATHAPIPKGQHGFLTKMTQESTKAVNENGSEGVTMVRFPARALGNTDGGFVFIWITNDSFKET